MNNVPKKRPEVKIPSSVFKRCPACGSSSLTVFEEDVFCTDCEWDSLVAHADAMFDAGIFLFEPVGGTTIKEPVESTPAQPSRAATARRHLSTRGFSGAHSTPSLTIVHV